MDLTIISLLSTALFMTMGLAIYFCIRMYHLQSKIDTIRKITEDFNEEHHVSEQKESITKMTLEQLSCKNMKKVNSLIDYDAVIYFPHEGNVSFYKYANK